MAQASHVGGDGQDRYTPDNRDVVAPAQRAEGPYYVYGGFGPTADMVPFDDASLRTNRSIAEFSRRQAELGGNG